VLRPADFTRDDASLRRTLALSFAGKPEGMSPYFDQVGRENFRVLDEGNEPVKACLARIPLLAIGTADGWSQRLA
jgi:hypothetical protein